MIIKILRVQGIRSREPAVMAIADGHLVKWTTRRDWNCACLTDLDEYECAHIETVRDLMDDRVLTPIQRRAVVL